MEIGISFTTTTTVTTSMLAAEVGSGDLPVLATPSMIAQMEHAAMLCVAPHLSEDSSTVGSEMQCSHLRPTPCGDTLTATATLTAEEGRKLTFSVTASDSKGIIGEGTHVRYIIQRERFLQKALAK